MQPRFSIAALYLDRWVFILFIHSPTSFSFFKIVFSIRSTIVYIKSSYCNSKTLRDCEVHCYHVLRHVYFKILIT